MHLEYPKWASLKLYRSKKPRRDDALIRAVRVPGSPCGRNLIQQLDDVAVAVLAELVAEHLPELQDVHRRVGI